MQSKKLIRYLPNILTLIRVLLIPAIVCTFYSNTPCAHRVSAIIFGISAITDFLDGYIARRFHAISNLGKILDPLADKLLICSVLMMIIKYRNANEIPCLLILIRELILSGLRELLAIVKVRMPVMRISKIKTAIQMISIFFILLGSEGANIKMLDKIAGIMLWTSTCFTLFTGYFYLKESLKIIEKNYL